MNPTPKIGLRIADKHDLPKIVALLRERDDAEHPADAVRSYLYDLNPARIVVWIAESNGEAVAINAIYLRDVRFQQQRFRAGYWAHLYVSPEYRKAMVYPRLVLAMLQWARHHDLDLVYTAMRRGHVTEAHLKLGFRTIGTLPVLIKPLRPVSLLAKSRRSLRWLSPMAIMLDTGWAALGWLCRLLSTAGGALSPPVKELSPQGPWVHLFTVDEQHRLQTVWSDETCRRRFMNTIEGRPYRVDAVYEHGVSRGEMLTRVAERGNPRIRALVIMDLFSMNHDTHALRRLLWHADRLGRLRRADVVLLLEPQDRQICKIAKNCGYLRSPERYTIIIWSADRLAKLPAVEQIANWRFSFAEHDAF